jgi:hypothetical protein
MNDVLVNIIMSVYMSTYVMTLSAYQAYGVCRIIMNLKGFSVESVVANLSICLVGLRKPTEPLYRPRFEASTLENKTRIPPLHQPTRYYGFSRQTVENKQH